MAASEGGISGRGYKPPPRNFFKKDVETKIKEYLKQVINILI